MNDDQTLREAFARKSPPPGFRARVMANVRPESAPRASWRGWGAIAAGLVLTVTVGGWTAWKTEQRRIEGERASQELKLALRIAGEKVRVAQDEIRTLSH